MKKYLRLFIINSIAIMWLYVCYLYPKYDWSIKAVMYVFLPLSIACLIYYISNSIEIPEKIKNQFMSLPWNIIDYIFDIIILSMLVFLDYRVIFILYIICVLFTATLKYKVIEAAGSIGGRP